MIKTILFPTDNSIYAKRAMEYVEDIAIKYKAEVILLHTYHIPYKFPGKPVKNYIYLEKIEQHMKEQGELILNEVMARMEARNIKVKPLLIKGFLGPAIVSESEAKNCDLVVMGSRGRGIGNVTSLLISSASNYTIHNCKCPVLFVH